MNKLTKEQYQAAIPECCEFQDIKQHEEYLMYCWGLANSVLEGYNLVCGDCPMNKENHEKTSSTMPRQNSVPNQSTNN